MFFATKNRRMVLKKLGGIDDQNGGSRNVLNKTSPTNGDETWWFDLYKDKPKQVMILNEVEV